MPDTSINLSVVAPVFNDAPCVDIFYSRVAKVLEEQGLPWEIILVDDGSRDDSWVQIRSLHERDSRVRGLSFSRNFGQHQALSAGLDHALGEWVILMDCDLQDRPEEIPGLLRKVENDNLEIVLARRSNRKDSFFKKAGSRSFYWCLNHLSDIKIDPATANFGIYHRRVVDCFCSFKEHQRFIPGLIAWSGFSTGYLDVEHGDRHAGQTAYNFKRILRLASAVILAHSDKPLRMSVYVGFATAFISAFVIAWLIIRKYLFAMPVEGWTSVMVSLYFVAGLLLANMGMLGLYIGRIFDEVKGRPLFVVKESAGIVEQEDTAT